MKNDLVKGQRSKVKGSAAGFSLVEMLFYIAILSLALLVVTETLLIMVRSYGSLRAAQQIAQDASLSLERMMREIRDANGTTDAESVLGLHPGELFLSTTDARGAPRTVEFSLSNGQLVLKENGVQSGALTSTKTSITNMVFRKIVTARSKGVKIELSMRSGAGSAARSENFHATAVLRDSY